MPITNLVNLRRSPSGRSTRYDQQTETSGKDEIDTPSLAYRRMEARWDLVDDLRGGSDTMRDGGATWLPQETGESDKHYKDRLNRTFLLPAYDQTLDKLVGKPFSRDISFNEDEMPRRIKAMIDNFDGEGTSASLFFRAVFEEAMHRGIVHVLVEFPQTGGTQSLAQEDGLLPRGVMVTAVNLRGWKHDLETGELLEARILVAKEVEDGAFGEKVILEVQHWTREWVQLYRGDAKASSSANSNTTKFLPMGEPIPHTFGAIPLATLNLREPGSFESRPMLWGLAEMNLEHWQKKSDQDNLLHVARVPILARFGFRADELKKDLVVGAGRSVGTTSEGARIEFIEHQGRALGAGSDDLARLEEQMEREGLQPLVRRVSSQLATSMAVGDAQESNELQGWARLLEMFVGQCFELAARWTGEELPDKFQADVYNDFGLAQRAEQDLRTMDAARSRGDLSRETYLREVKRRGVLADGFDVEEELERIEEEGDQEPDISLETMLPAVPPGAPAPEPEPEPEPAGA